MVSHRDTILDQFTRQAIPFSTAAPIRDERALGWMVEAAGTTADDTVLDVACGPGLVAAAFARVARRVTGIDLTPAMIERARELGGDAGLDNLTFELGDVLPLPYPDASFSVVVSRFAFHHFRDPASVLAEMRRVCLPGGRVQVTDVTSSEDPAKAAAFHEMEILRDPSHVRALTLPELRGLFTAAGFAPPREKLWAMDIDVTAWLARSFPAPDSEPTIRRLLEESIDGDTMGLHTRRDGDRLAFVYTNVILTADR